MFPDVDAENRAAFVHQRAFAVGGLGGDDLAVDDGEPTPARTELSRAGLDEVLLGFLDRAERIDQRLFEFAGNLAAAVRLHPFPEMEMVVVLARVVEQARILAVGAAHDVLERLAFPFRALEQIVAVVDIGQMVLVVVVFERFLGHVGGQGVMSVGQIGKRKGHRRGSLNEGVRELRRVSDVARTQRHC